MLKFHNFKQLLPKPLNSKTITILADGSEKNRNKQLCSGITLNVETPNSPITFSNLNKMNIKQYQFPIIKLSYDRVDVVEHAQSAGIHPEDKHADLYLNKQNSKLQVLPTFIYPFETKLMLDVTAGFIPFWKGLFHGESYIEQLRPLPPEGIINVEAKTLDVLDKGTGTLYCFNMNVCDENGKTYFIMESHAFEAGTGGFNGKRTNPHLTRLGEPKKTNPDSILEFSTIVPKDGFKETLSDSDMNISEYSPLHPRQYYSRHYSIANPVAHGRYTFSAVVQLILAKYGNGNVENFKAAKVRFTNPVLLGEKILISTWEEKNSRIIFQGDVQRNGKRVTIFAGGYIDLNL